MPADIIAANGISFRTGFAQMDDNFREIAYRLPATSVMSNGATGDGVTDDTQFIQSAVDEGAGKVVIFPPGMTFAISKEIVVPAGTTIQAYGAILKMMANFATTATLTATDLLVPADFVCAIRPSQAGGPHRGIRILGLTIDGNGANQANGYNYIGIITANTIGMLVQDCYVFDMAHQLNITNVAFSNCSYTDATKTLVDQTGSEHPFANASPGMRLKFTAGANVDTTTIFTLVTITNQDTAIVNADINGINGNIASGVAGTVMSARAMGILAYGNLATGKTSYNARIVNCTSRNVGYDAAGARGSGCRRTQFIGCVFELGKQTAFQAYDRAYETTLTSCSLDNTGATAMGGAGVAGVGAGLIFHAAQRCRAIGCNIRTDGTSNTVNIFGDNANGYSEAAPNYGQDNLIDDCFLEYTGTTSGIGNAGFDGAGAGYQYARRNTLSNNQMNITDATSPHANVLYGTDVTGGGLSILDNTMVNAANEACINLAASRNMVIKGNRCINTYTGGFSAAKALTISAGGATTPMGTNISGNYFANTDDDVSVVTITGTIDITFNDNVVEHLTTSVPSVPAVVFDATNDLVCVGNKFLSGTSSTSGVISIVNTPARVTISNNQVRRGLGNTTQPARGIGCTGGTYIIISNNDFSVCTGVAWGASFTLGVGCRLVNNSVNPSTSTVDSAATGQSGVSEASIPSGSTTVVVTHNIANVSGRALRASDIVLNLTNSSNATVSPDELYVRSITSTQFTIACRTNPSTSGITIAWSASLAAAA